ncbi:uncharacterized protein LOC120768264 isoform X1 [Bactrocera tryoni]|uniref:uncharacterized protein LOC120768264 isoform X1 n=1 Tax=Bactrocera tryoni TaxID=59916 RepID=UPI001A972B66|nr:uncharacterized protein LOC120768264 isoform X1 [Bactrocera tryoni]
MQSILDFLQEAPEVEAPISCKVLQMCPHFNQLKHIFGKKATSELPLEVVDSGSTSIMNESAASQILEITFSDVGGEIASPIDIANTENLPPGKVSEVIVPEKAKDFAEKMKKYVPKSSAANLVAFQDELRQMFKMEIEWEKEKHEKDHALNERRLQAGIERGKAEIIFKNRELDLKILELEKDERLKKLKLEKVERLQKFEIEMKYKYSSQQ